MEVSSVSPARPVVYLGRLRGVSRTDSASHVDQSRNKLIAAANSVKTTTAAAPTRPLSRVERASLDGVQRTFAAQATQRPEPTASATRPEGPPPTAAFQEAVVNSVLRTQGHAPAAPASAPDGPSAYTQAGTASERGAALDVHA